MDGNNFDFRLIDPADSLSDFVYCFSSIQNLSTVKEAIIIPNGKIDLIFTQTTYHQFKVFLMGLENKLIPTKLYVPNFFDVSSNLI
jgi:hypothetical protein